MSSDGLGVLWRSDGTLSDMQYKCVLENIMVPSVRLIYPDGIIKFQQDNHPVHTSSRVMRWFSERPDINLIDWPPRSPDLNPIEHVWAEVKKTMRERWPRRQPTTKEELWETIENAWNLVSSNHRYCRRLVSSMPRRLQAVIEVEGLHTRY